MEILCTRCHQPVLADNLYCPTCGLPQLMYSADAIPGQISPERFNEPIRDASTIDWKRAMRLTLALALPAGVMCSLFSPVGLFGFFWMAMAASWTVALYLRSQRPAWITVGAGARIGLVTGLVGGWTAAATSGLTLFVMRFFLHKGSYLDDTWNSISDQAVEQWTSAGADAQLIAASKAWMLSPEGRAGSMLSAVLILTSLLVFFAIAGGALGARFQARARRPQP